MRNLLSCTGSLWRKPGVSLSGCRDPAANRTLRSLSTSDRDRRTIKKRTVIRPGARTETRVRQGGGARVSQQPPGPLGQRLLGHMCSKAPVTDLELLLYMIRRHVPFDDWPDRIGVSDQQLAQALVHQGQNLIASASTSLSEERLVRLMVDPGLAAGLMHWRPNLYPRLPDALKTEAFLAPLVSDLVPDKREDLLRKIICDSAPLAQALAPVQELVRASPWWLLTLPQEQVTPELRRIAVTRNLTLIRDLEVMTEPSEYQALCDLALASSGAALGSIALEHRTPARVDKAVTHHNPPHPGAIPEALRTGERLRLALQNGSRFQYVRVRDQLSPAFLTANKLWGTLKEKDNWLHYLPEEERTAALWSAYIDQKPVRVYEYDVPASLQDRRPAWEAAAWQPDGFMSLSDMTCRLCRKLSGLSGPELAPLVEYNSALLQGQFRWPPVEEVAPWALVVEGFWDALPPGYKDKIWHNGGTEGLGPAFGVPDFDLEPEALLDPVQEHHCTLRAARLPAQVKKKLMFCGHFQPRHQALGLALRASMLAGKQALEKAVAAVSLPVWSEDNRADAAWMPSGGRTLVRTASEDGVVHMKFWRQGETLATFAAEQAVQAFARDQGALGWKSEIPRPGGIVRVPIDEMPVAPEAFPDKLQVVGKKDRRHCLAFCFTTRDHSYAAQALRPDEDGKDCSKAREGLLRAFHDLGLWSSLGAVHTSTIKLYHHFHTADDVRPELLLGNLFQSDMCYPGTVHLWNTVAIEQSDWGLSGLRDLGDLEFYPCITTYVESVDASWVLEGYGQRASFVNAMAHNILGGLLHYMCAHRQLPDYHYKNSGQVGQLAGFVQEACNLYLGSLLGDGTRLETLIPAEVYPQWLSRTAQEMIYWSARQTLEPAPEQDGFAQHINRDGRPCPLLYPGHPRLESVRYGVTADFTEAAGESLGTENGKLPLFYLMRGLYMMAAGVADRLAGTAVPQPMTA